MKIFRGLPANILAGDLAVGDKVALPPMTSASVIPRRVPACIRWLPLPSRAADGPRSSRDAAAA